MEVSDGELARTVAAGRDPAAEAEFCRRFARRSFLYGLKHLRDEGAAHDLAQEVLLTVLAALRDGRVQEPERLASFVLGTCRLLATGWQRRERRRDGLSARLPIDVQFEPTFDVSSERLHGCLERPAAREQRLLTMSFCEDRSAEEIGAALGLSAGNVRVLRHRTLAGLRECIEARAEAAR